ncbi:hypothetical protein AMK59_5264 [Oryctes borbonicus]|uniref:Uncharacterized protein n=1 Tax=Oryctes borbonicus TaxID=1629725 RepID=A0A0T6B2D3_9SCAR|nr:hypothetical protein AMK59_5264 [Oryctes borbonicus]
MINSSVTGVDLENIYQSVAYKLRKEKGQHLDSFMNTFLASTGRVKPNKVEWAEIGDELDNLMNLTLTQSCIPKTHHNKVFGNNFNVTQRKMTESASSTFNPSGIAESLFYILKHTFKVSYSILKLYTAVCNVAQHAFESLCKMFIEKKIKSALSQNNLAVLIEQLEEMLEERKVNAFAGLQNALPHWLALLTGEDFKNGMKNLLEILQNPLYNKQLAYNLLDIVITEFYPDLGMS